GAVERRRIQAEPVDGVAQDCFGQDLRLGVPAMHRQVLRSSSSLSSLRTAASWFSAPPRMAAATRPPRATSTGNSKRMIAMTMPPAMARRLSEFVVAEAPDDMVVDQ